MGIYADFARAGLGNALVPQGKDKSRKKDKEDKESQDKEASVNKQAYDWTWENVGNTAKEWGRETLDFVKENPWTSAGIAAVPIAGIVGLSSKRRNKLRNFLLTLAGMWGLGGLALSGPGAWDAAIKKSKAQQLITNNKKEVENYNTGDAGTGEQSHSNSRIKQDLGPDPETGLLPGEAVGGAR